MKKRTITARLFPAAIFIGFAAVLVAGCASSAPAVDWKASENLVKGIGRLEEEKWKADLDLLVRTLESRHPNPWHAASREDFLAALKGPAVPAVTRSRLARSRVGSVMKALALLQEGHTRLIGSPLGSVFPLGIVRLPEGFYVGAGASAALELIGGRLISVNGLDMTEVHRRLLPYVGAESEGWADIVLCGTLMDMETLKDAGILGEEAASARIEVERDGDSVSREIAGMSPSEAPRVMKDIWETFGITPVETISRNGEPYWYRYFKEENAVLVQYNVCRDAKDPPFAQFCNEVFALVERERPERLVLDLRYNSGGNSGLFTFNFLPKIRSSYLNRPGGIVVLIGPHTFSSGIFAVSEMKRYTQAVLAGEPAGQGYNHYGMTGSFMLPNSGLVVQHSTRYWQLDEKDTGNAILPDVSMPRDAAAMLAGKDPVIEAAIRLGR
jgi:hypothetical protein